MYCVTRSTWDCIISMLWMKHVDPCSSRLYQREIIPAFPPTVASRGNLQSGGHYCVLSTQYRYMYTVIFGDTQISSPRHRNATLDGGGTVYGTGSGCILQVPCVHQLSYRVAGHRPASEHHRDDHHSCMNQDALGSPYPPVMTFLEKVNIGPERKGEIQI